MARLAAPDRLGPSDWPDWVLAPPGGFVDTEDGRRQAHDRFHAWRRARADWFAEHGVPFSWQAAHDERRRRAQGGH